MIKFKKVTKRFGPVVALREVSFEIKPGEFVFITGPSGAGKTTIARLILREYLPTSGEVEVGGLKLNNLSSKAVTQLRRRVGVVFQDFKLLKDRTVFENVALVLKILGKKEEEIKMEVKKTLKFLGLAERAEFFPRQLAGGELQRVCLARAVVAKPEIIIADEPTGNLDLTTAWQIIKLLEKIHQLKKTVIVATHNFEIVNSMRRRVIELDQGRLISDRKKGRYRFR